MYWDRIAKKGCLVPLSLVPLNESLGVFSPGSDVFWCALQDYCSTFVKHIQCTSLGLFTKKTFPVHCNSLPVLSFDSVMCIIMRTATCDNIHVFSSADLKAQFRFTDHCSFVVRMSAKLFLEMIYKLRDHTTFQWEFIRKE